MHFLLSTLFLGVVWIGIQVETRQIPLVENNFNAPEEQLLWNFSDKPSPNSTSHLIFNTVNSFLQHWTNTRYRNGQMIIDFISLKRNQIYDF
jgi:hypothetical protein